MSQEVHHKAASYKPCSCGNDCGHEFDSTPEQPCWGQVEPDDDPREVTHACKAHEYRSYPGTLYNRYVAEGDDWPIYTGN